VNDEDAHLGLLQRGDRLGEGEVRGVVALARVVGLVGLAVAVAIAVVVRSLEEGVVGGDDDHAVREGAPREPERRVAERVEGVLLADRVLQGWAARAVARVAVRGGVGVLEGPERLLQRRGVGVHLASLERSGGVEAMVVHEADQPEVRVRCQLVRGGHDQADLLLEGIEDEAHRARHVEDEEDVDHVGALVLVHVSLEAKVRRDGALRPAVHGTPAVGAEERVSAGGGEGG
jgi:hypothetical protein